MKIIKRIAFILVFASGFSLTAQNEDLIVWSESLDSTFSWEYYSKRNLSGEFDAISNMNIVFKKERAGDTIRIVSAVYLNTKKSYYNKRKFKKSYPSENLLRHEKLHFDIDECYRRLMFQKIAGIKCTRIKKVEKKINRIYLRNRKIVEKTQKKYDSDSNFSKNQIGQRQWGIKIHKLLNELSDYQHTELILVGK
jgi:hypothetical protein